jgi:hypothetical protein
MHSIKPHSIWVNEFVHKSRFLHVFDDFRFEKEFVVRRARVIEQLQDVSDRAR